GASDAGPEGEHEDHTAHAAGPSVTAFGEPGGVGVVDEHDLSADGVFEHLEGVDPNPRLVDVVGGVDHAVADDRGESDPDRARLVETALQLPDHGDDRGGGGRVGGVRPQAI